MISRSQHRDFEIFVTGTRIFESLLKFCKIKTIASETENPA